MKIKREEKLIYWFMVAMLVGWITLILVFELTDPIKPVPNNDTERVAEDIVVAELPDEPLVTLEEPANIIDHETEESITEAPEIVPETTVEVVETTTVENTTIETTAETTTSEPEITTVAETRKVEETTGPSTEMSDIELIARIVWLEARGESYEGQVAVAEVILNRVNSKKFPNTVYDVIYQRGQFTTAKKLHRANPSETQYAAVRDALNGNGVLNNPRCVYFSMGRSCGTYYTTIGCHVFGCE